MINPLKIANFLGIQLPVKIDMVSAKVIDPENSELKYKKAKDALGHYYYMKVTERDEPMYHLIIIYLYNFTDEALESIIAHELIHAWQAETGFLLEEQHGTGFISAAEAVEREFGITGIYRPTVDKE